MKFTASVSLFLLGNMLFFTGVAQENNPEQNHKKNFIKVNLTSIILKNYSLQYEHVFTKKVAVALSYRTMPNGTIPFKKEIEKAAAEDGDQETVDAIRDLRIENFAITPEVRFYLGKKGWGRGFYIAPFYRYAEFKANNLTFNYGDNQTVQNKIALAGKVTSNTGGLAFGAQWALGKVLVLDWTIIGPHYGAAKGDLSGASARPLTAAEQEELRRDLEDIDLPLTDKTIIVNASGATMKLDGPWGGVRAAISLGVRF